MTKVTPLNYELVAQKKWREFLLTLPEDRTQFDLSFESLDLMKSFKSTAYEINSDGVGDRVFSLSMDKVNLKCTVTISPRQ